VVLTALLATGRCWPPNHLALSRVFSAAADNSALTLLLEREPRVTCGGRPVGLFQQLPSSQEVNHAEPVKKKNRRKADDSSTTITASSRKSLTRRLIASFDRRDNHFR
jgi:hypothetical protein